MTSYHGYSELLDAPDLLIGKLLNDLNRIDPELCDYMKFRSKIQIENLQNFIKESIKRIHNYEHIYPFIKEICTDQQINPIWYSKIEKVLEWALKKGRGERNNLSIEIKDAWLTYIVVVSFSMIDRTFDVHSIIRKNKIARSFNLKGNN